MREQTASSTDTVTSPFGADAIESVEHLNEEHGDTIEFIARVHAQADRVVAARISAFDHIGMHVWFETGSEHGTTHIPFAERVDDADAAFVQFYGILNAAREREPDGQLTSIEQELTPGVVPTWITEVTAVSDITSRIRQITVSGGLETFTAMAPDQFVFVLAPPPGVDVLTIDSSFSWSAYYAMPEADRPVGAYYTIRRWNPAESSIDLWVVLHGHDGNGERWARTASVGSPVALWGPRDAYDRPASCDHLLLLGDETALPAIAAILESLAPGDRATVVVSAPATTDRVELRSRADVAISWVSPSADDPNPLLSAVHRDESMVTTNTYVWGGAESRDISAVRRFVRDSRGLTREQVSLTGYWRRVQD